MSTTTSPQSARAKRRRGLTLIALACTVAGVAWGGWHWLHSRNFETTDNAYVAGNVVQITPQIGGTVIAIHADDTDFVRAGQPLVELDNADTKVALAQAQAKLASTVREVRQLYANTTALQAQVQLRRAELARAQAEEQRLRDDVRRRAPLTASGAVGKEEYQHASAQLSAAQSAVAAAQSAIAAAQEQLAASAAQTEGVDVARHPGVLAAAAQLRQAWLAEQRTHLLAPLDGQVAKRGVQIGQRIAAGAPVMTVVPLTQLWVDANFKESQLRDIRIGQAATLVADLYGDKVSYHGRVVGLGAGTGAAFALLPAQNATGNWIKVVQRVPVRITLDPKDLAEHPLRVGLSMDVSVDIRDQSGAVLPSAERQDPVAATSVFDEQLRSADALVARIIADNLGRHAAAGQARAQSAAR